MFNLWRSLCKYVAVTKDQSRTRLCLWVTQTLNTWTVLSIRERWRCIWLSYNKLYRPPPSKDNCSTIPDFLDQWSTFLAGYITHNNNCWRFKLSCWCQKRSWCSAIYGYNQSVWSTTTWTDSCALPYIRRRDQQGHQSHHIGRYHLGWLHSLTRKKTRPNTAADLMAKQSPTSGRGNRNLDWKNQVYKRGELLLYRWLPMLCAWK
jgi:hypothetical protein